ncbi:MAG: hypothetical protein RR202_10465 [Bacteroidales bacterium]
MSKILDEYLGCPGDLMKKIDWDPSMWWNFRKIFLEGLKAEMLDKIHNGNYRVNEDTLTLDRNIEIVGAYIQYAKSIGHSINDVFALRLAHNLYEAWYWDLPVTVLEHQMIEIAKPFYK